MSRPKAPLSPELVEARKLRAAVIADLKVKPSTAGDMAAALAVDHDAVRMLMCRLVKAGIVKSVRSHGKDGKVVATYHYSENVVSRSAYNVSTPHRPVLKEWPTSEVRDPFALPEEFFGARAR